MSHDNFASRDMWNSMYRQENCHLLPFLSSDWVEPCERALSDIIAPYRGGRLLDFGCGPGMFFPLYKRIGFSSVIGVDSSMVACESAKGKVAGDKSFTIINDNSLKSLAGTSPEKFDVIIFWGVVHHLPPLETKDFFKKFSELLKEDGVFVVSGWSCRDKRRFASGSYFGCSPILKTKTCAIESSLDELYDIFEVERSGSICDASGSNYDYYVCRKRISYVNSLQRALKTRLARYRDEVLFYHFVDYSISKDFLSATLDTNKSHIVFAASKEAKVKYVFSQMMSHAKSYCGGASLAKSLYARNQKKSLIVAMEANPSFLLVKELPRAILVSFTRNDSGDYLPVSAEDEDAICKESRPWDAEIIEKSLKEYIDEMPTLQPLALSSFDNLRVKKQGNLSNDILRLLYYALNVNQDLFFYCFVNNSYSISDKEIGDGGLVLFTHRRMSREAFHDLERLFVRWSSAVSIETISIILNRAAVKSAISAIMARNGSHNIGSHVLSALSHNVGTMPDDRVLYQYIQHRMDYIAAASTDFPSWKQPVLLVGNLIRGFLSQRHLLDFIVDSEGLHGYKFQDKNLAVGDQQLNTIRIHVRKRNDFSYMGQGEYEAKIEDKGFVNFIEYDPSKCAGMSIPLNEDVELAIPGGVVGQHAFYTIIENVLRNAAKHDWAHFNKTQKEAEKWLDVYIDFWDCIETGKVEFLVWCKQSILNDGKSADDSSSAVLLNSKELEVRISNVTNDNDDALEGLTPIQKLQVRINVPFIDRSGKLRRENWGLAEMRISAGFLQGRDIAEIGGLEKKRDAPDIVSLASVHVDSSKNADGRYCLGYRFYVEKPRELLVLVSGEDKVPEGAESLNPYGIYFKRYDSEELVKKPPLPYAYVVTSGLKASDYKSWALPFRTLSKENYGEQEDPAMKIGDISLSNWIPWFSSYGEVLQKASKANQENAKDVARDIMDIVYASWTKNVIEKRFMGTGEPSLSTKVLLSILAQDSNPSAAGKGLVTTFDLLKMVFEYCFNTSIRSYANLSSPLAPEVAAVLSLLLNIRKKPSITSETLENEKISTDDPYKIICRQILAWIDSPDIVAQIDWNGNEIELIDSMVPKKTDVSAFKDFLSKELYELSNQTDEEDPFDIESDSEKIEFYGFLNYLEKSTLEQARVFLTKYEENIITLPSGYDVSGNAPFCDSDEWSFSNDSSKQWDVRISYTGATSVEGMQNVQTVEYRRHFDFSKESKCVGAKDFPNVRYIEALSGTQSYLNSLVQMSRRRNGMLDKRMAAMLLETGLMRILIIDERVAKFAVDHPDVGRAFSNIGIEAINHEHELSKRIICDDGDLSDESFALKREILIIHQGIIDKLCKHHDSSSVAKLIDRIRASGMFRYVVITTGRGTPANLPLQARVLPFSTVEGTLFKKYPEKFLLVNAIMSILPIRKEEAHDRDIRDE